MASKSEQVTLALLALLQAAPPSGHSVERFRVIPVPESGRNRTILYPAPNADGVVEDATVLDMDNGLGIVRTYRTETVIDPGSEAPDAALDPYYIWLNEAIMVDRSLGGLAQDIRRGPLAYSVDENGRPTGIMIIQWEVHFNVNEQDPEAEIP